MASWTRGLVACRLVAYALARVDAVLGLMERLATLPEAFEMARVTGLTLNQASTNSTTSTTNGTAAAIRPLPSCVWCVGVAALA